MQGSGCRVDRWLVVVSLDPNYKQKTLNLLGPKLRLHSMMDFGWDASPIISKMILP